MGAPGRAGSWNSTTKPKPPWRTRMRSRGQLERLEGGKEEGVVGKAKEAVGYGGSRRERSVIWVDRVYEEKRMRREAGGVDVAGYRRGENCGRARGKGGHLG